MAHSLGPNAPGVGPRGVLSRAQQLSAVGWHPRSRISIHRCYKVFGPARSHAPHRVVSRGIGPRLCRILDVNFREVIMALQGHLEAMKMEEVVAWLTSWLRTGAAKESPSRSVAWEPRGHLKLLP